MTHSAPSNSRVDEVGEATIQTATFPLLNLIHALERRDEDRVWNLYRVSRDQPLFLDWLANWSGMQVSTRKDPCHEMQVSTWVHVLFAVPIVRDPGSVGSDDGFTGLPDSLQKWFGAGHEVHLLGNASKYASVARWSPLTQKEHLAGMCGTPFAENARWTRELTVLDRDLPSLTFLLGTVGTRAGAPEFPEAGYDPCDRLLQQEIGFRTLGRGDMELDDHIGRVAPFADAVQAGLLLWIDALARAQVVQGWNIEPIEMDVLLLQLSGVEGQSWQLPLRSHQIGLHGIDLLVARLAMHFGPPVKGAAQPQ